MGARAIVEPFDVVEDLAAGLSVGDEVAAVNEFKFAGAPKTFHGGVVVAIAFAAQGGHEAGLLDTQERREFTRRLVTDFHVEDERLKGVVLPAPGMVWNHDQQHGAARIIPRKAVVLILTDEHQRETIFGFFKYPAEVTDIHGKVIAETGLKNRWISRDFVDSPDPRFRKIVRRFADAGFLESERDEFDPAK